MARYTRSRRSSSRSTYSRPARRSTRAPARRTAARRGSRASSAARTIRIVIAGDNTNAVARPGMPFGVAAPKPKTAKF